MCLIAAVDNEEIKILGYSHKESRGIVGGAISDMRLAQKSITNVVSEAERMAGLNIEQMLIALSGSQVISNRKEEGAKTYKDLMDAIGKYPQYFTPDEINKIQSNAQFFIS